jgi:hypothetical protein
MRQTSATSKASGPWHPAIQTILAKSSTNRSGSLRYIAGIDLATRGDVMRFALLLVLLWPLAAFLYVMHELSSGESRIALAEAPPLLSEPIDWRKATSWLKPTIDPREAKRLNDENFSRMAHENSRRMQEISAYMRNPVGSQAMPPPH